MNTKVWIMGQIKNEEEYLQFEFMGVFTSEEKAVAACTSDLHFIGPAVLDERHPDETIAWEGSYYPIRDKAIADARAL